MVWTKTALKRRNQGALRKDGRNRWIRRVPSQQVQNAPAAMFRDLEPLGRNQWRGAARRRVKQRGDARRADQRSFQIRKARFNYFRDANDSRDWNERRAQMIHRHGPKALLQPPWRDRLGNHEEDDWEAEAARGSDTLLWNTRLADSE